MIVVFLSLVISLHAMISSLHPASVKISLLRLNKIPLFIPLSYPFICWGDIWLYCLVTVTTNMGCNTSVGC